MEMQGDALLIVDPDSAATEVLVSHFSARGYSVDTSHSRDHAMCLARSRRYSAFIIGLTSAQSELSFCRHLRMDLRLGAPVVVISDCTALTAKLRAFQDGADDYMVKPLSPAELGLRVENRIVRSRGLISQAPLRVADLVLDTRTRRAERAGQPLKLTPTTFNILKLLMSASPRVVSRSELIRAIWQGDGPDSDSLRSHLYALRKEVNRRSLPQLMRTVRTRGIQITATAHAMRGEEAVSDNLMAG